MIIKLRVLQEVHFDHARRRPGDVIEVNGEQFENERGEFECPRWAAVYEPRASTEPAELEA